MSVQRKQMQKNIQRLVEERDRLQAEFRDVAAAMRGRIAGLETAIAILQKDADDNPADPNPGKPARGEAKTVLIDLLREQGTSGLNATIAADIAKQRGIPLKRETAASNLSRLKKDGVVVHDGERYRLPEFARPPGLVVVPGMAS
jgi:hypothetical protein